MKRAIHSRGKAILIACAALAAAVALMIGCGGGKPCGEGQKVCGSDGKLWCGTVSSPFVVVDMACCAGALALAGPDAAAPGPDGGAAPLDSGLVLPPSCPALAVPSAVTGDAGITVLLSLLPTIPRHPGDGVDAGGPLFGPFDDAGLFFAIDDGGTLVFGGGRNGQGQLGDAGEASILPHFDDGGVPYLFRCEVEVCHAGPDGGYKLDSGPSYPCGPVGCP